MTSLYLPVNEYTLNPLKIATSKVQSLLKLLQNAFLALRVSSKVLPFTVTSSVGVTKAKSPEQDYQHFPSRKRPRSIPDKLVNQIWWRGYMRHHSCPVFLHLKTLPALIEIFPGLSVCQDPSV